MAPRPDAYSRAPATETSPVMSASIRMSQLVREHGAQDLTIPFDTCRTARFQTAARGSGEICLNEPVPSRFIRVT